MRRQRVLEGVLGAIGIMLMIAGASAHLRAVAARANAAKAGATPARADGSPSAASDTRSNSFAVVDARVFDGNAVIDRATVVVESGVITAAGRGVPVPKGLPVVNAYGKTLLPGLIDAHTHAYEDALERAVVFGVTTELDMFTDPRFAAAKREEQRHGVVTTRADLLSAGVLATAPHGHGTEYGIPIPTLTRPDEAQAWVDARIAEGSDYIKIISDDGASYGLKLPTLDRATVSALVAAAHRRGKKVLVHVSTLQAARDAVEAGADGLAHVFGDAPADAALVGLIRQRHVFVIPTLTVLASTAGQTTAAQALARDPALAIYVGASERRTLDATFPARNRTSHALDNARATVAALEAAGVPLLAGTDAPNPGTAHGLSLHEELELLVSAGLSPVEALAAATSVPARLFGLADRGRIATGLRADLLLVDGDPTVTIAATRRIAQVWKGGVTVERKPAAAAPVAAPVVTDGAVSDFETDTSSRFGFGWQISTDSLMGGTSEASMRIAPDGASGSRGSLEITGSVKPGTMFPWAGPMFFPGQQPMTPVNLSRFKDLVFWAKGDGGTYRVMMFATRLGRIPAQREFPAGPDWREVVMPLPAFGAGFDGSDVQGVLFSASPGPATFRLQIDSVRFR
jgi:imidazolonepropionase-like amidohydrolase